MRQTRVDRLEASGVNALKDSRNARDPKRCTSVRWTDADSVPVPQVGQFSSAPKTTRRIDRRTPGTTPEKSRNSPRSPRPPEMVLVNATEQPSSTDAQWIMPLPIRNPTTNVKAMKHARSTAGKLQRGHPRRNHVRSPQSHASGRQRKPNPDAATVSDHAPSSVSRIEPPRSGALQAIPAALERKSRKHCHAD